MAFMAVPASAASSADRTPVLAYNAKSGRLALHDRVQDDSGEWSTIKTDVTKAEPAFAVDFGRLETGYIYFSNGRAPLWAMAPHGQRTPPEPESPGTSATGKPLRYKPGFRVPVVSRAIGGVREFAGNSAALIAGMNELHTEYEAAPEARVGKLPLVKLTDVLEMISGQASNYQPVFTIVSWVDRPEDVLGPRTVAPPGSVNGHRQPAQPTRAAPPATRYADEIDAIHAQRLAANRSSSSFGEPPADRWGDEGTWDAPPRQAGGGRTLARARFAAPVA
jgi:hypothetical protein